ncbi:hypothetical protein H8958_012632 [Nasalis larvatus]
MHRLCSPGSTLDLILSQRPFISAIQVDLIEAQETAPSRCLHLDAENEVLQLQQTLFSMKAIKMQCETLQKSKKQLKREVVNLKSYMERNMLAHAEAEQHKRLIEEKARKEIEKVNEAMLTLQKQAAASQEELAQFREDSTTAKTQMELTIKDLESEVSRMKTSSANFNKTELKRYKELYLEEVKFRESLSNELNRKHIPTKKKSALESMESFLLKMKQKLENDLTEVTAAAEPEPYAATPLEAAYWKNRNQDPVLEAAKEYAQILYRKYKI